MWRSDAIATLYFFRPLRAVLSSTAPVRAEGVPILMYHSVAEGGTDARHPYFQTSTRPAVFQQHMEILRDNGFSTVTLAEATEALKTGRKTVRPVVITFDDGYRDFLKNAFPILNRYGFSATVFLPTAFIGERTVRFKGLECLTWDEVSDLHSAGIQFGSHTVTHPQLHDVTDGELETELRDSKKTIEERLGTRVTSFAYPYAFPETDSFFTSRLRSVLEEAGYQDGVCTGIGIAGAKDGQFFMKRLPVNSFDDPTLFQAKLQGHYNWLHTLQYVAKLRRRRSA
jgi:peptidoglycan/xylan/chitin deacetylase (PgdA/CDA1 family)